VLELGAGIGFISTIAARLKRAASYLALEPNPHLPEFIRSVQEMNAVTGMEVAHGLAAAIDYTSAVDFYIRKDFWMSSLSPEPLPIVRKATTPAIPLAMLLQERNINVIISDIEGAEVDLFSRSHLEGVERVYVEIHEHLTGFQGVKTLFDSMSAKGFIYDYRCSEGSIIMFRRP
jgi:FkbM family methyltransferase